MLQKEFTNLVLRTLSKKGIRFWQIIQQVEVLRSVHEKTTFVTTPHGQFVKSLLRPVIVKLEQEGGQLARCNLLWLPVWRL